MKRKEGISLIVLVITIVVIVILATAVILSIANNNPIGNASEAVEKNNRAEYESELSLYIAKQYADKNGEYDPTTLNKQTNEVSEIITSLSEKDKEKYIIWQGELYKKEETSDGIRYVNSDGERAKFLDEETEVTETMIEFLKAFNEKQDSLSEEDKLLYNGGYITGTQPLDKSKYIELLPINTIIKYEDSEDEISDSSDVTTDMRIYFFNENTEDYEFVARVVAYGDFDKSGIVNPSDPYKIYSFCKWKTEKFTIGQLISADLNFDGILDEQDVELAYDIIKGKYNDKSYAKVPTQFM